MTSWGGGRLCFIPNDFRAQGRAGWDAADPLCVLGKEVGPVPSSSSLGCFWKIFWLPGLHQRTKQQQNVHPEVPQGKSRRNSEVLQEWFNLNGFYPSCSTLLAPCPGLQQVRNSTTLQIPAQWKCYPCKCLPCRSHLLFESLFPFSPFPQEVSYDFIRGFVFFYSFFLHLFGCSSCPPAVSLFFFSSWQLLPVLAPNWNMGNQNVHWAVKGQWELQSIHSRRKKGLRSILASFASPKGASRAGEGAMSPVLPGNVSAPGQRDSLIHPSVLSSFIEEGRKE